MSGEAMQGEREDPWSRAVIAAAANLTGAPFQKQSGWSVAPVHRQVVPNGVKTVVSVTCATVRLAAKTNVDRAGTLGQARALDTLATALSRDDVVPSLYVDPAGAFFLMPWVDAPVMWDCLYGDARASEARALSLIGDAGRWLRRLHDARLVPGTPSAAKRPFTIRQSPDDADDLVGLSRRLMDPLREMRGRPREDAMLHGDFQAKNLFVCEDGLRTFDVPRPVAGHPLGDVARFLLALDHQD